MAACTDTRTERVVTESDILAALPDPLPPGWSASGPIDTGFSRASNTTGACGGPNTLQIALDNGATARVGYPWLRQNSLVLDRWFYIEVYAFPSEESARDVVNMAPEVISKCPSFNYTVPESDVDGFLDGNYDDAEWLAVSNLKATDSERPEAQSSVLVTVENTYSTTQDGDEYSFETTAYDNYASYGSVVIVTTVAQTYDYSGYEDSEDDPDELEIVSDDLKYLDQIVSMIRKRLGV